MFPKKEPLVELKNLRSSVNTKSVRYFRKGKQVFMLGKEGFVPIFYTLTEIPVDSGKSSRSIKVDGLINWGQAFSWADAERAIMDTLGASCIQRDHETADIASAVPVSGK
jgi:hypothetical protein